MPSQICFFHNMFQICFFSMYTWETTATTKDQLSVFNPEAQRKHVVL